MDGMMMEEWQFLARSDKPSQLLAVEGIHLQEHMARGERNGKKQSLLKTFFQDLLLSEPRSRESTFNCKAADSSLASSGTPRLLLVDSESESFAADSQRRVRGKTKARPSPRSSTCFANVNMRYAAVSI